MTVSALAFSDAITAAEALQDAHKHQPGIAWRLYLTAWLVATGVDYSPQLQDQWLAMMGAD